MIEDKAGQIWQDTRRIIFLYINKRKYDSNDKKKVSLKDTNTKDIDYLLKWLKKKLAIK